MFDKRAYHREYMRKYLTNPANHKKHLERVATRTQRLVIEKLGGRAFERRVCKGPCGKEKFTYEFRIVHKRYSSWTCRQCFNKESKAFNATSKRKSWERARAKRHRRDPERRAACILSDSRASDQKAGRKHDLDYDFIASRLSGGCAYCSASDLKLSLDRKDNSLGHLKSNVVVACLRCNLLRNNMPYAAWLALVPAIRRAEKRGLFVSWRGRWNY